MALRFQVRQALRTTEDHTVLLSPRCKIGVEPQMRLEVSAVHSTKLTLPLSATCLRDKTGGGIDVPQGTTQTVCPSRQKLGCKRP